MQVASIGAMGDDMDVRLTPTQPVSCALERPCPPPSVVCARLNALAPGPATYELLESDQELLIGRHHDCRIVVNDRRASARHVRIFREVLPGGGFCYMVDQLSSNNCFLNEQCLRKGQRRRLRHGDHISLCMYAHETRDKPFAAYVFQIAAESAADELRQRLVATARPAASAAAADADRSHLVTEEYVREHWDLSTVLGSGGFSEVRLGIRLDSGEQRAVKVIDKAKFQAFRKKRDSHLSLRSEAEMMTSLTHPGVVRFYEWFETPSRLFLVMELLSGGDLLDFIIGHGCLPEPQARRLFREVAEAVAYLHEQGVVHRDLKPENVMLTSRSPEAHAKLVDFGLARNAKSRDCHTFCGTPQYFAPEVIGTLRDRGEGKGQHGYGVQVDAWSLGVVLYIVLSGVPPFDDDDGKLYRRILEGKFDFDVPQWCAVSDEAKDLVKGLLNVNPKERLRVVDALRHPWLLQGEAPAARVDAASPTADAAAISEAPVKRRRTDVS